MLTPYRDDNWRNNALPAQHAFINVAQAIAKFEKVMLGVHPSIKAEFTQIFQTRQAKVHDVGFGIELFELEYDDSWMRDVGPTILHNSSLANIPVDDIPDELSAFAQKLQQCTTPLIGMDWVFNAWGRKYSSWGKDDLVASMVIDKINSSSAGVSQSIERIRVDFVLEGGSIHVDGEGTVLVTEECLLNRNRNPQLSRQQIEQRLRLCLGVQVVIWLPHGLVADHDTDGHIDNIACFARPGQVLLSWTDDEADADMYAICREALNVLSASTDALGRTLEVIKLPLPEPMYYTEEECDHSDTSAPSATTTTAGSVPPAGGGSTGALEEAGYEARQVGSRMAGSYVNFYIANKGIVVPSFGQPAADSKAVEILTSVFGAEYEVISVEGCREILLGGGNIHCITQQQPAPHE